MKSLRPLLALALAALFTGCCCSGTCKKDAAPDDLHAECTVDCRPSDAIALAVQTGAPIQVARAVFEEVATD